MSDQTADILLFGGSFDPPHHAHVTLPLEAAKRVGARETVFIPTGLNPQKEDQQPTEQHHRVAMLEAALHGQTGATISHIELDRPTPHYTIDTLMLLRDQPAYATATMRLLIGADQALNFRSWRDWQGIVDLAEPLVMPRPPYDLALLPEAYERAHPGEADLWMARTLPLPTLDECSTNIRQAIAEGASLGPIVPEGVERYIREHGLYGFGGHRATIK